MSEINHREFGTNTGAIGVGELIIASGVGETLLEPVCGVERSEVVFVCGVVNGTESSFEVDLFAVADVEVVVLVGGITMVVVVEVGVVGEVVVVVVVGEVVVVVGIVGVEMIVVAVIVVVGVIVVEIVEVEVGTIMAGMVVVVNVVDITDVEVGIERGVEGEEVGLAGRGSGTETEGRRDVKLTDAMVGDEDEEKEDIGVDLKMA
jgi:hypothetical protein